MFLCSNYINNDAFVNILLHAAPKIEGLLPLFHELLRKFAAKQI